MTTYIYTEKNRLTEPNTYFYTKFHGAEFLKDWQADRSTNITDNQSFKGFLKPGEFDSPPALLDVFGSEQSVPAEEILGSTLWLIEQGEFEKVKPVTTTLLKRFEVTKKIYEFYERELRATDKEKFHNLNAYILASGIMTKSYIASKGEIPFLNGLLKINDTIKSVSTELSDSQKTAFSWLLSSEKDFVNELFQANGLSL